jgi:monoamine oxidase
MAADTRVSAAPDLLLASPVAAVEQDGQSATVTTRDGRSVAARAVVMTAPLNTWNAITFSPALSAAKQAAANEGQASRGVKVWVRVRGELPPFLGSAPDTHAINWIGTEDYTRGGTVLVGFGAAADRLDLSDREAVAAAVREFLPHAEVEEVGGHDWVADEFSRGTWPVFRPGQLTRYLRALQQREGRLILAGSELANGWSGFIDGAIESGLTAARQVTELLGAAG